MTVDQMNAETEISGATEAAWREACEREAKRLEIGPRDELTWRETYEREAQLRSDVFRHGLTVEGARELRDLTAEIAGNMKEAGESFSAMLGGFAELEALMSMAASLAGNLKESSENIDELDGADEMLATLVVRANDLAEALSESSAFIDGDDDE